MPPPPARALAGAHPWATVGATALESRIQARDTKAPKITPLIGFKLGIPLSLSPRGQPQTPSGFAHSGWGWAWGMLGCPTEYDSRRGADGALWGPKVICGSPARVLTSASLHLLPCGCGWARGAPGAGRQRCPEPGSTTEGTPPACSHHLWKAERCPNNLPMS